MKSLTIIIPLYNKRNTILKTLRSCCQNCTILDVEIIVVNDGSTDDSLEIVKSFVDDRVKLINQRNMGVSVARNRGIEEATKDYIIFLDADDEFSEGALDLLARALVSNSDIYVTNFMIDGKIVFNKCKEGRIKNPFFQIWAKKMYPRPGNTIIKRTFVNRIKGFYNKQYLCNEDIEYSLRLIKQCSSIEYCELTLMDYRIELAELSLKSQELDREYGYNVMLYSNIFHSLFGFELCFQTFIKYYRLKESGKWKKMLLTKGIFILLGGVSQYVSRRL